MKKTADKLWLLSAEETGRAAVQRPLLQGWLCRRSSALSEASRPSPPAGTASSPQTAHQYQRVTRWIRVTHESWSTRVWQATTLLPHGSPAPLVNPRLFVFSLPAEWEDRYDLLHSRLLPLYHQGARRAGQGRVEQHGERRVTAGI